MQRCVHLTGPNILRADLMRSGFGAGFPLFATAMYKNLGVAWASSTLGFLSIAFIPIPFVLYRVSGLIQHATL